VEYLLAGSRVAVDVVYPASDKSRVRGPGPSHEDFERLARGELPELILADRYRLERRLGRGGMGSVYFGRHVALGRPVAVKVLDAEEQEWSWAVARFMREARLAAKVRHRNIVDVYDFGSTPDGVVYIVMEALFGRDLRAIIRHNRLNWQWARYLMRQICAGVEAIHQAGVVHRDLKASNCFYVEQNRLVKVLDFGIAAIERVGNDDPKRMVVGTPEYMAPEQIRGAPADRRSDVYAGGILLCELLTGRTPFAARTAEQVFDLQLHAPPPSLWSIVPELVAPQGLDAVLARALAKEPRRRFQSMRELAVALEQVESASPLRRLFGGRRTPTGRNNVVAPKLDEDAPTLRSHEQESPRVEAQDPDHLSFEIEIEMP
jgi:serine/threonine protein kinase